MSIPESDLQRLREEPYSAAITVTAAIAALVCIGAGIVTVITLLSLIGWLQPGVQIPVTSDHPFELARPTGTNSYDGAPWIPDGNQVEATGFTAQIADISILTRVMLALTPALWAATTSLIGYCTMRTAWSLRSSWQVQPTTVGHLRTAALVLVIGSTLAQATQLIADAGLGTIGWNSPAVTDGLSSGHTIAFNCTGIGAAIGILALSTVLARALPTPPPALEQP